MKRCLLGTSANPIHNGHILMAQEILNLTDVNMVTFLLNSWHPEGKSHIDNQHRIEMCRLATKDLRNIDYSTIEIDWNLQLETAPLIRDHISKHYKRDTLSWAMGYDVAGFFHEWKDHKWMVDNMTIYVGDRHGLVEPEKFNHIFLDSVDTSLSSRLIRTRIKDGVPITGLVHPEVEEYIHKHKLYT